jgi:hypothetical protein
MVEYRLVPHMGEAYARVISNRSRGGVSMGQQVGVNVALSIIEILVVMQYALEIPFLP